MISDTGYIKFDMEKEGVFDKNLLSLVRDSAGQALLNSRIASGRNRIRASIPAASPSHESVAGVIFRLDRKRDLLALHGAPALFAASGVTSWKRIREDRHEILPHGARGADHQYFYHMVPLF